MKITLGTVQFGINYGISNTHGVPSDAVLKDIFATAQKWQIEKLDTAAAYGNAEERIGTWASKDFQIISKFPKVGLESELETALETSLKRLQTPKIYGYLSHNADVLIENPALWKALQKAKAQGKVEKIGFSLYHPEQLDQLLSENCIPDLVQLPYSILDRKFEAQLGVLKELQTEIHVRSVFLQGLYFFNPDELPEKLQPLQNALNKLHGFCKDAGVSVAEAALNYVNSNPHVDQLVLGVETAKQLEENAAMITYWKPNPGLFEQIEGITVENKSLLNPVNW